MSHAGNSTLQFIIIYAINVEKINKQPYYIHTRICLVSAANATASAPDSGGVSAPVKQNLLYTALTFH